MKYLHSFLLLLGLVFLAFLVGRIGVDKLWHELLSLGWGLVLFIALEFAAEGFHTIAWSRCLSPPYRRLSWLLLFRMRLAGSAINYVTPTAAMGGEVAKAGLLSTVHQGPEAIGGVLMGRVCSGAGHLLIAVAGSVFVLWRATLPPAIWAAMFLSGTLVAAGIAVFLLLQKHGKLGAFIRWLAAHKAAGRALQNLSQEIGKVDNAMKTFYRERPGSLALAVGWHMVGHSIGFLQTWCFFGLLHQPVSAGTIAAVWILGLWFDLLTFAVPLNMGTLEGTRIVALKAVGYGAVLGMTYGLASRLAQLSCACFGLVSYALFFSSWRPFSLRWHGHCREPVRQQSGSIRPY